MASDSRPPRVPFSFELFPPRPPATVEGIHDTIRLLAAAGPEFMSVTYGANGSSRERSLELLRFILEQTSVRPMAHLTCVGSTSAASGRLVREFLDSGVTSFLALRGDPPQDAVEGEDHLGDLRSAAELVQLIHRVQAERAQFQTLRSRGDDGAGILPHSRQKVHVAVATFPNGHERDRRDNQDIDALIAKQTAGATMAITQLFFRADDYLEFVERAKAGGVTIPIVPGLMPATTPSRLRRVVELTGERMPTELARRLDGAVDRDEQFAIGVEQIVTVAAQIIAGGAPALHLYTFNQHRAAIAVLGELGLLTDRISATRGPHGGGSPGALDDYARPSVDTLSRDDRVSGPTTGTR